MEDCKIIKQPDRAMIVVLIAIEEIIKTRSDLLKCFSVSETTKPRL